MINNNKINPDLKAQLKKAKVVEQKQKAKLNKTHQKAQEQVYKNDIRKFTIDHRTIGAFKNVSSNPISILNSLSSAILVFILINKTSVIKQLIEFIYTNRNQQKSKK